MLAGATYEVLPVLFRLLLRCHYYVSSGTHASALLLYCGSGRTEPGAVAQSDMAQEDEGAAVKAEPSEAARRLAWLPATAAAVSLRLAAFDAAVTYVPGLPPARDTLQVSLTADYMPYRDIAMAVITLADVWHIARFCDAILVASIGHSALREWVGDVQAYKYIQRPAAPMQTDTKGAGPRAHGTRVISGQPIGMGGRARPSTFPPFPQACHALPLHAMRTVNPICCRPLG